MGIVTYIDHTLGLSLSPRTKQILKDYKEGKDITKEDIGFLIDMAARFETIDSRVRAKKYPIKDFMLEEEYEIKDVLSDMMLELNYIYATRIAGNKYFKQCKQFEAYSGHAIERFSVRDIEGALLNAIGEVKKTQKEFDDHGDDLTVIGSFPALEKHYGFDYTFTADVTIKEMQETVIGHMQGYAEKEQERLKESLDKWQKVRL